MNNSQFGLVHAHIINPTGLKIRYKSGILVHSSPTCNQTGLPVFFFKYVDFFKILGSVKMVYKILPSYTFLHFLSTLSIFFIHSFMSHRHRKNYLALSMKTCFNIKPGCSLKWKFARQFVLKHHNHPFSKHYFIFYFSPAYTVLTQNVLSIKIN